MRRFSHTRNIFLFISIFLYGFFPQTVQGASAVINPTLSWSTFFGGNLTDQIRNVITDSSGNIYAVGYSDATWGFPIVAYAGHHDAFLAKFNSSGNLVWNTFMGASTADVAYSLVRDTSGNIYVTGYSSSTWGSPIAAFGGVEDAFVAKFDSSGNRIWNTFIGGAGQDEAYGISVGADGNIYILGGLTTATWGSPIRSFGGSIDGFLEKLDTSGNVLWHTFIGGTGGEFVDSFVQDNQNNIYVAGYGNGTWGSPLHAHSGGGFDGYIAKFDNSGNLTWNTFFGGSGNEFFYIGSMVLDSGNNLYATGYSTATWGSPLTSYTTGDEGYLVKFDSNGSLTWNTFFGGSGSDQPKGITIDSSGNVYVIGKSTATWGSPFSAYVAGSDGFLAGYDDTGSRLWSTFMGGSGNDTGASVHYFNGDLFVGGDSTATWGSPINAYNAGTDSFLARYDGSPLISLVSDSPSSSNSLIQWTTNEAASSKVDYGLTSSYGNTTDERDTTTRVADHSVTLSGLASCTTYHYRVRSSDAISQERVDSDHSFVTNGCPESSSSRLSSCVDQIPGNKAPWLYGAIPEKNGSIRLYFTPADEPITNYVLEYGTGSNNYQYGAEDLGTNTRSQMTFSVNSLAPNTTYYFRVRSQNGCAPGNWSNEIFATTNKARLSNTLNATEFLQPSPAQPIPTPTSELPKSQSENHSRTATGEDINGVAVKGAAVAAKPSATAFPRLLIMGAVSVALLLIIFFLKRVRQ